MNLEFPYQIVTFLNKEPEINEPVYQGENGWYPQLALKRRFKLNGISEETLVQTLKEFFSLHSNVSFDTGELTKPAAMPVRVIDIPNQSDLKNLHDQLIAQLGQSITSRYPERDGKNYYAHITAEYNDQIVIPIDKYTRKTFSIANIWLLKDIENEDSQAYIKIK